MSKVYRIYSPINRPGMCGTVEFGIFKRLRTARDYLERIAAEFQMDHGYHVAWLSETAFATWMPCGAGCRVLIREYELNEFIKDDLTEKAKTAARAVSGSKAPWVGPN